MNEAVEEARGAGSSARSRAGAAALARHQFSRIADPALRDPLRPTTTPPSFTARSEVWGPRVSKGRRRSRLHRPGTSPRATAYAVVRPPTSRHSQLTTAWPPVPTATDGSPVPLRHSVAWDTDRGAVQA